MYDSGVLHRILGIDPNIPVTVDMKHSSGSSKKPSSSVSYAQAAQSVKSAWEEAEMVMDSDDEEIKNNEEEESRYRAADARSGQPPTKRRKTGKDKDIHTVYTTDDEEDEDPVGGNKGDKTAEEEAEYAVLSASDDDDKPGKPKKSDVRSFWLSKGIGSGGELDEYSDT